MTFVLMLAPFDHVSEYLIAFVAKAHYLLQPISWIANFQKLLISFQLAVVVEAYLLLVAVGKDLFCFGHINMILAFNHVFVLFVFMPLKLYESFEFFGAVDALAYIIILHKNYLMRIWYVSISPIQMLRWRLHLCLHF